MVEGEIRIAFEHPRATRMEEIKIFPDTPNGEGWVKVRASTTYRRGL